MTRATGTTLTGTQNIDIKSNSNIFTSAKIRPQTSNATAILSNMRGDFSPNEASGFGDAFISNEPTTTNNVDQRSQATTMNKPPRLPIDSNITHKRAISNMIGTREQITKSRFKLKDSVVGAWQGSSRSREKEQNYMSNDNSKEANVLLNSQVTDGEYTQSRLSRSPMHEHETEQRFIMMPKPSVKTALGIKTSLN